MASTGQQFTFDEMIAATGLSPAQATVACHRIGKDVFGLDIHTVVFTAEEIQKLTADTSPSNHKPRKQKKAKQPHPGRKSDPDADWRAIKSKSPAAIAHYMEVPLDLVIEACETLGLGIENPHQTLKYKDAERVRSHVLITELEKSQPTDNSMTEDFVQSLVIDLSQPPQSREKKDTPTPRATSKRVEVIARETNESIERVRFVIDALEIPVIAGDKEKVPIRYEDDIKLALGLLDDLPNDRLDRGQVRIRPMIESRGLELSVIQDFCNRKSIPLSHGKYATIEDGLRLSWMLSDPQVLYGLRRLSNPTTAPPAQPSESHTDVCVVDYQGIDLSRQNFTGFRFDSAVMTSVNLGFSKLVDATFATADLSDADLTRSICVRAEFVKAVCSGANFTRAVLDHANFSGATLTRADFTGCTFVGTVFTDADLSDAIISLGPDDVVIVSNTRWSDGTIVNSIEDIERLQ